MNTDLPTNLEPKSDCSDNQSMISVSEISVGKHSYRNLGQDYAVDIELEYAAGSRLVLFDEALAEILKLDLPETDKGIEQVILESFAWFKCDNSNESGVKVKTLFATRYQDSDDKSEGSALGDGRASWSGEIVTELESGNVQYLDVVLKGTGATELAWINHPKENHKDGMVSLTEAVHEYIYSLAAKKNGIRAVDVLAVIELPFYRAVDNEKAVIVVRVGNHLRFAHYCYFSDNTDQLKKLFEYGLKRNLGLSLTYSVKKQDVKNYLELIVNNLASDAAVYFDVHAVHGSPTFGNITSCGGTIDFATFVFIDAHHSNYSYMSDGVNSLGGDMGQTEQFFNLFSHLLETLKQSQFIYADSVMPVEYFLRKFNDKVEQILTYRWMRRIGLSITEIDSLSIQTKENFYENVKFIYELEGSKKIKFKQKKIVLAAFEPRKILSATADHIENISKVKVLWEKLFHVARSWGTYKFVDAKPYIKAYQQSINNIVEELSASKQDFIVWQQRSKEISLSERKEPGEDFFYDSERFFASEEVLRQINSGNFSWRKISETAAISVSKLVDHGLDLK